MKAQFVQGVPLKELLDPDAGVWRAAKPEALALSGTPSALQPTSAVRVAFPEGTIGAIKNVSVAAVHNGTDIAFRLEWRDPSADTGADGQDDIGFPDGAAILFPTRNGAPLMTMGAPGLPVNAWYWRADENGRGRHVTAQGLGTTDTADLSLVKGQGSYNSGSWRVVIARPLQVDSPAPVAQLKAGGRIGISFAIWEGSHKERAGIKSFALGPQEGWHELSLDRAA
ncbi:hypothetical protein B9N43_05455 [Denitratisoma sp. DHT3]|uniref:ethylbenzene dehydrogenase-related protein n=1 Tax=Denitratisoma sp. DHT3 TaxID=1981880 RepID=UPI0011985627|nr:ethylbenzene dehydrogenase-related protein [Denitratisoma sp. DHT3]QDX80739.1 hypothetical protein B9N43_05455 [Denitratisoma sp. DHT3]